jgi:hypothetical protein
MFSVSLDALKQALGMANEASKAGDEATSKPAIKSAGKSKKLQSKSLSAVVSLTQKVGAGERV